MLELGGIPVMPTIWKAVLLYLHEPSRSSASTRTAGGAMHLRQDILALFLTWTERQMKKRYAL